MNFEDFKILFEEIKMSLGISIQSRNLAIVIIILAIAILWNQRKIKKQLRQLLEEWEKEDKPNN